MRRRALAALAVTAALAGGACAREIHLDCARPDRSVAVDVDTNLLFVQLIWAEGVAEEYRNGDSYLSGPSSAGEAQKVTYSVSVDADSVSFGQDRVCVSAGAGRRCKEQHLRNLLDAAAGVLKYDDEGVVDVLKCTPAPPGRRF